MKFQVFGSVAVAIFLFGGCSGGGDSGTQDVTPTAASFTGDALASEVTSTLSSTELGVDDKVFDVSTNTEINNNNYTYNYSEDGGVIAVQKIDWTSAVAAKKNIVVNVDDNNLSAGYTDGDYNTTITDCSALPKPIPKVICDVSNNLCLTYNITCLKDDVTVAVTPYKSVLSMPNGAKFAIDDNNTPLTGISADVSVQNSNGTKLSLSDANKVVKLTAKITNKNSLLITASDYKLYKINGSTPTASDITLTNSTSKVTSGYDLDGFYPYVIAKATTYTTQSGTITLGGNPLFDASIVVLDDNNKTIAQTKTNSLGVYSYKLPSTTTVGSTKIISDLLKNGIYETTSILSSNLNIDSTNSGSVIKTDFTTVEKEDIKSLLGKKISSSYYSYDEPLSPDISFRMVKPAGLFADYTSSTTMQNLAYPAINHFLKGVSVTNSSGTLSDGNNASYSIVATADKLTISIINTTTDSYHTYNENTTLTITKNSDGTFAFVVNEYQNNGYISSSGSSYENYTISWTGTNSSVDISGAQIQTVSNGKVTGSFNASSSYTSVDYTSSYSDSGSDSGTFSIAKLGEEFIVSATQTTSEQKSDSSTGGSSYSMNETKNYTMKAKYGIILDSSAYTMSDSSNVVLENLNSKRVQNGTTSFDMQNVSITAIKDGSNIYINGVDASGW